MIADDVVAKLYRQGGSLASLMAGAHCVHVPFGIHGCDPKLDELMPLRGNKVCAEWARPPFDTMVLVGDGPVSLTAADYADDGEPFGPVTPELIASLNRGIASTRGREVVFVHRDPESERAYLQRPEAADAAWLVLALKVRVNDAGLVVPAQWALISGGKDGHVSLVVPGNAEGWMRDMVDNALPALLGIAFKFRPLVQTSLGLMPLDVKHAAGRLLHVVATTFALMNCQNVVQVAQQPFRQARRAAARAGGPKPFVVHHLHVRALRKARAAGSSSIDAGPDLALHWVRGHFKTYTAEKPLLGRASGTFWWTPHLAGDIHEGVVVKDYTIDA